MIRENRDTLYSSAVVDISEGATLTLPDGGDRYLSVMVVNNDHYINDVLHAPGQHELSVDRYDTEYVLVAARILVDPNDPADLGAVHQLQDQIGLDATSARPFVSPDYDSASFDSTRAAILTLARGVGSFAGAFGRRDAVDPIKHLLGTASGWGGLPEQEAFYLNVDPGFPTGEYKLTVRDVPVDGFWSISVYNADGFFEPTNATPTASTTSPRHRTRTGPSPFTSAGAATTARTACRSWTVGTTPSACIARIRKFSTAAGPSPKPNPRSAELQIRVVPGYANRAERVLRNRARTATVDSSTIPRSVGASALACTRREDSIAAAQTARTSASRLTECSSSQQTAASHAAHA